MSEPFLSSDNMFADHQTIQNLDANSYKSYDATTGKLLNCIYPQIGPMQIAIDKQYTKANKPTETQYNDLAVGNCKLTNFPKKTHPELYDYLEMEWTIFNKLYINSLNTTNNTSGLVPQYSGKTITCPTDSVPYVLQYSLLTGYNKYIRFCATSDQILRINFTTIGDYYIYKYTDDNIKNDCNTSTCTTPYASFLGHSLQPEPYIKNTDKNDKKDTLIISLSVVGGLIVLGLVIYLLVKLHPKIKRKIKNKK